MTVMEVEQPRVLEVPPSEDTQSPLSTGERCDPTTATATIATTIIKSQ